MTALISGPTLQYYLSNFFEGNLLKAMICTDAFVFDPDVHTFTTAVTNEVSGTGYTAGGISLVGVETALDTTNNEVRLIAENAEFGVITVTNAAQIVIYTLGTTATPSRIVSVHTFTPQNVSQEFTYIWPLDTSGKGVIGVFPY